MQSAVETIEAAGYTHHAMYASILSQLATIELERNNLAAMLALNRHALEATRRNGRGDTTEYVTSQQNIAVALSVAGEVRESLELREQVNRRAREFEPDGHIPFPYALNYSTLLLRMARPEEARAEIESALDRVRRGQNRAMLTGSCLRSDGRTSISANGPKPMPCLRRQGNWWMAASTICAINSNYVARSCRWREAMCSRPVDGSSRLCN